MEGGKQKHWETNKVRLDTTYLKGAYPVSCMEFNDLYMPHLVMQIQGHANHKLPALLLLLVGAKMPTCQINFMLLNNTLRYTSTHLSQRAELWRC